jgi:serine/threonine-protein kinase
VGLRPDDKALAAYLIDHDVLPLADVLDALKDSTGSSRDLGESLVKLGLLKAPDVVGLRAEVARERQLEIGSSRTPMPLTGEISLPLFSLANDVATRDEPSAKSERDTVFDVPKGEVGSGSSSASLSFYELTPSPGLAFDGSNDRTPKAIDEVDHLGPTAPSREASQLTLEDIDDVLSQATLPAGRPVFDPLVTAPEPQIIDPADSADDTVPPPEPRSLRLRTKGDSAEDLEPLALQTLALVRAKPSKSEGVELDIEREEQRLAPSGRKLDERYQMLGEIARGGMGRILKARDTEIGREVAVKVLIGGQQPPESLIRRFWMEVQATGQLEHPSIIPIHDVGRLPSGELFYVMKKLSGTTLADVIADLRAGTASEEEYSRARLLTLFQQIAYAVAFAHARGVIHRDIKPANIMIGRYGEAMLLDWGLAKLVDDPVVENETSDEIRVVTLGRYSATETASGTITGTPQYMSPEATHGQPELLTTKSDVYGLGAVLYEILTLEPPFPDLGFVPTVVRVRKAELVSPRKKAPDRGIPVEMEELCLAAMARDPSQRPAAKKLADEIGRILEGAKERERRGLEAKLRVREGRKATDRWKALKVELQSAESEAKRLAKEIPSWAPIEKKRAMWALEDRVSELKIEAISAFEEGEAGFLRALGEVPDDREARSALASLYYARFGEAERARDVEGQRYYRNLVARYDDGVWGRIITGDGSLEITATPSDVEIRIAKMESEGRMLRPTGWRSLGRAPIARFDIPIGSYLLECRRQREREILRPVLIGRTERVSVNVRYRSGLEIGDAFILIPEGPAILGGDSIAHGGLDRRVVDVGELAIARFPVTCEEYLTFINALAEDDADRALRHVPRARAQEGYYWRYNRTERRFEYPEKSPGGHAWVGNLPVSAISMIDAQAYIEWRARLTGESLRLPHENEWEKAARGVDGRFFPWGDHFDPTFCKMKESRDRPYPEPEPVGAFAADCSPYGVRDMAGGVRELCVTDEGGFLRPVMRGGCWSDTGLFCRVAFRHVTQPDFVNTGLGFRLVKDLDP